MNIVKKPLTKVNQNIYDNSSALDDAEYEISLLQTTVSTDPEEITTETTSNSENTVTVTTSGKTFVESVEINEGNIEKVDIFTIKEKSAPSGFKVSEELKDTGVEVKVFKDSDNYIIDHIEVDGQTIDKGQSSNEIIIENNSTSLRINISDDGTEFTVNVYNDKDNFYTLQMADESEEATYWIPDLRLTGAEFSVKQYIKSGNEYQANNVTTNDGEYSLVQFSEDTYNKYADGKWRGTVLNSETVSNDFYRYVITKTKEPNDVNYTLPSWVKEGKNLILDITPNILSANKYGIDHINIYLSRVNSDGEFIDENGDLIADSETVKLGSINGNSAYNDSENKLYVSLDENNIFIGIKDPKIEGQYAVKFGKVEATEQVIGNTSEYIDGARYEMVRIKDVSKQYAQNIGWDNINEVVEGNDDIVLTTENNLVTAFETSDIDTNENYDVYLIKETEDAKHYKKNDTWYKLLVYRGITTNSTNQKVIAVNSVKVYKAEKNNREWEEITDVSNSNEVQLDINDEKTEIKFVVTDERKKYDLALTKTIVYSDEYIINKFDINFDNVVDSEDISIYEASDIYQPNPEITNEEKEYIQQILDEYDTKLTYRDIASRVYFMKRERAAFANIAIEDIVRKLINFDIDEDGNLNSYDLSRIMGIPSKIGAGLDMDRFNSILTQKLNTYDNNNNQITTSEYKLDKKTFETKLNDIITYKITVLNEGDYDAKNIKIVDYIPEGLAICDSNGNKVENGTVTCLVNGNNYTWTVEQNGKKATYTTPGTVTLEKYDEDRSSIDTVVAYITCCVDYESRDVGGTKNYNINALKQYSSKILYDVAEIVDSTPIDKEGNIVYATSENKWIGTSDSNEALTISGEPQKISDRDSEENSIITDTQAETIQNILDIYKDRYTEGIQDPELGILKSNYEYQDDDDFEKVKIKYLVQNIPVKKKWNIPKVIAKKYKVTIQLSKMVNNNKQTVASIDITYNEANDNFEGSFTDVPVYDEDGNLIEYDIEETRVQKTEDNGVTWEEVPLTDFTITYGD